MEYLGFKQVDTYFLGNFYNDTHLFEVILYYRVVDLNAWFKAWEEKIDYGKASLTANNSNWQGKVVTPQQFCDEYNEFFGYDNAITLNNVLGACEEGDIYALLGLIQLSLNNGEIINYPCLFMGLMEFQGVRFAVGELSTIFPVPMCGGWVVSYVNGYIEYDFPYYEEYGNIWPAYSDVVGYGGILYENTKYFVPAGQVDTTDDDEDGLYDIYELTGMRIANGQVIYTKTNTDAAEEENETLGKDSDGDGLLDGEEIIRYDTERGYFVMKSDPNDYDSDDDGLHDHEDPEPMQKFDSRFMIVDSFDYVPSVEFVDRHYEYGEECYLSKTSQNTGFKNVEMFGKNLELQMITNAGANTNLLSLLYWNNMTDSDLYNTKNFSKLLNHYLNGNGNGNDIYLSYDDMVQIIFSQKSNTEHLESNIYNLKMIAEEICPNNGKEIYISTSGGNDFKATCYRHIACNHMGENYDNVIALDWGYAIGESFCGMVGKVYKKGDFYFMDIKYYLLDIYEFPVHWEGML